MKAMSEKHGWFRFMADGWKVHWVTGDLLPGLVDDATFRGHSVKSVMAEAQGSLDQPGMIMGDRTYQDFDLGGFTLSIPTTDCEHFRTKLRDATPRLTSGGIPSARRKVG